MPTHTHKHTHTHTQGHRALLPSVINFPGVSDHKESACGGRRLGFDPWVGTIPLEEGMATHSSILAWRIPRTEEPGGLRSTGSQESDLTEHAGSPVRPLSIAKSFISKFHTSQPQACDGEAGAVEGRGEKKE